MGTVLALNATFCVVFFKELKLCTFDPGLAASLGFRPGLMHYGLMAVVSATAVAAFDSVGPVLVVGYFVVPAATAYLLTDRLGVMIVSACGFGVLGSGIGVYVADRMNANTAGTTAAALGLLFATAFIFAPERGQIALLMRRHKQRRDFEETMLAVHLYQHEGTEAEADEAKLTGLHSHLTWDPKRTTVVVQRATANGLVLRQGNMLKLTEAGRARARAVFGDRSELGDSHPGGSPR
jgi:manganese/zinc/iron transport system permease protein